MFLQFKVLFDLLSFSFFGRRKKKDTEIFASIFFLPTHFSNLGQAYLAVLKNQLWRFFFLSKIVSDMMCVCE